MVTFLAITVVLFLRGVLMSIGVVTLLEVQKRNKKRVNVFIDDEYAFSVSLDEAALLRKGQVLSEAEIEALKNKAAITVATDQAARFLAVRPRSVHEVRQNLAQKKTPSPVIDAAVERLSSLGYLNDQEFAEFWVKDRNTFKPVSPRALRFELRQKGVPEPIIAHVLADLDAEDTAYRAAQGQVKRLRGSERRVFRDKLYVFLQRRGFAYETARATVRRLMEELDAEDAKFFAEDGNDDDDNTET